MTLTIRQMREGALPRGLLYKKAAREVLGERYELDLIFATSAFMKKLNKTYRGLDKNTNVLSFGLDEKRGQLILDLKTIQREAEQLKIPFRKHLWELFLHGLLHLKGFNHGPQMGWARLRLSRRGL